MTSTSDLIQLTYASHEAHNFSDPELVQLLAKSRAANARASVTGILLYSEGNFFQVLEGTNEDVEHVFARVKKDPRHRQITVVVKERIRRRHFGEWAMGFVGASAEELQAAGTWDDAVSVGASIADMTPSRAKKLLQAFASGRWRVA